MQKERKDRSFIKKPIYEGGPVAMKAFIKENLRYPDEAQKAKIEGTVVVRYDIDHEGKVVDAKTVSGLGHGCDEEAIRLVHLLKFIVPKNRGVKVLFHKTIQIHFRLPKQKKIVKPPSSTISYTVTPKKEIPEKQPEQKPKSYTYTVRW